MADNVNFSVIGLFADDVRQEKSGQSTIVGIYQDVVKVSSFPYVFPKLAIVYEAVADGDLRTVKKMVCELKYDGTSTKQEIPVDDFIGNEEAEVGRHRLELATVYSPIRIEERTNIIALLHIDDEEYYAGSLRVEPAD